MKRGYTLVEVLVAVSIFVIFVSAPTGIFISSLKGQKRALAQREIIDGGSYFLEYIGRFLRMAKKDDLGGINCLSGDKVNFELTHSGNGIKFRNYKDECQEFYLDGKRIFENKNGNVLPLTSANLEVNFLKFQIFGETQSDKIQPRVMTSFEIQKKGQSETKTRFQTTISQRDLDVQY